jgi:CRISPR system Cascade subunit CasC
MSLPRFIQIHTLHTYPAALLNRDDAGLAKRLPLGNAVRTRISSQCLKRHWRVTDDQFALSRLDVPMAIRSRGTLELISQRIQKNGITAVLAQAAAEALRDAGLLDKGGKDKKGDDALKTGQAVLMGVPEIDYLVSRCTELAQSSPDEKTLKTNIMSALKGEKKNIEAIKHGSGLESALFGRMVTSDILASREASVSVAHAFTVHQAQVENDYFTVVDDLMQEAGELGSAGIFDTELASGLYYGYVVVDVPQLIENLEGIAAKDCFADGTPAERRELAGRVVQHLLHLIATVSPGAKRGSTAPFDWAKFMLVEAGDWQPRSLAGAFHDALPLEVKGNTDTIRQRAVTRITQEISAMDEAYGAPLARHFLALDAVEIAGAERANLTELGKWAKEIVQRGAC